MQLYRPNPPMSEERRVVCDVGILESGEMRTMTELVGLEPGPEACLRTDIFHREMITQAWWWWGSESKD